MFNEASKMQKIMIMKTVNNYYEKKNGMMTVLTVSYDDVIWLIFMI